MLSVSDFTSVLNQLLPEPHAGLMNGILFGTKASLSPVFRDALIRTGTIHITALSGMNITILMTLTATTLHRVFSRKITSLLTVFIIIGFILFVGPSASVIRAGIMGSLTMISVVLGRQRRALWILVVTTISMLLIYPSYVTDIGFQLSVLATLGIILFGKSSEQKKLLLLSSLNSTEMLNPVRQAQGLRDNRRQVQHDNKIIAFTSSIWNLIKDDLRTTLSAQVFTTPLIFLTFHRVSLLSPLANVLIGFLIAPLTVLGMIICLIGVIYLPLAVPLSWFAWLLLEYIVRVIEGISAIPFASIGG